MAFRTQLARQLRRTATPAERRLWGQLRAHRLAGHRFKRQQPIGPFVVDFICFRRGLIIEVDGPYHQKQTQADQERSQYLQARGFSVLRFPNGEIMTDIQSVLKSILQHLENSRVGANRRDDKVSRLPELAGHQKLGLDFRADERTPPIGD